MFIRTISGAAVLALTAAALILGGYWLFAFTAAVSLIGTFELYRVFQMEKKVPAWFGYAGVIAVDAAVLFEKDALILGTVTVMFLLIMAVYVLSYPKYHAKDILPAIFGMLYAGLMLSYVFRTRSGADGAYTVWLIFISSWGCDTCAYLTGKAFGKHKMAPVLSPKKSIEGAVGGVIGAAILSMLYAVVFQKNLTAFFLHPVPACIVIGACGSLISMVGDLAASAVKRDFGIKDYGNLIPGHGGIMDRFDSVIFTAPVIYYLVVLLQVMKG